MSTPAALTVIRNDPKYQALIQHNRQLKQQDEAKIFLQYSLLMQKDAQGQTVLHTACQNGDHKLLSFFIEKAGPNHLNILDKIIDVADQLELTALYQLCEQGFDKKSGEPNADRRKMLQLLIEGDEAIKKLPA